MNNLQKINAVIFDFDDTLVDSLNIIYQAYHKTATCFGLVPVAIEKLRHTLDISNFFEHQWDQAQQLYLDNYKELAVQLKPYEHTEEILQIFKKLNVPIVIISKKRSSILRHEITNILNWDHYFDLIIGGDDTEPKPSTIPVKYAAKRLEFEISKDVLFIGDSLIDIECAIESGCSAILIGEMTSQIINSRYKPDLHFENHQKLLRTLKGIL